MEYDWTNVDNPRPSFGIPTIYHQTLLAKTLFSHARSCVMIAAVAMASKQIQSSSLSPNFATSLPQISLRVLPLFFTVFHPSTSLPLQFVTNFRVSFAEESYQSSHRHGGGSAAMDAKCKELLLAMQNTTYMKKALHTLAITPPSVDCNPHPSDEKDLFDVLIETCGSFEALESLTLHQYSPQQRHVAMLNALGQRLPYLSTFAVNFAGFADQSDLKVISQVKTLTHFNLNGSSKVDDDDVIDCLSGLENLKSVSLLSYNHLNDGCLIPIARFGATLTNLDVGFVRNFYYTSKKGTGITDQGMRLIGENLVKLRKLNLDNNGAITDVSLIEHLPKLTDLRELCLRSCEKITNRGVMSLMRNNRKLSVLELFETNLSISSFEEDGVTPTAEEDPFQLMHESDGSPLYCFPNLRKIVIYRAEGFGAESLRVLTRSFALESIRCDYSSISSDEFVKFDESPEGRSISYSNNNSSGIFTNVKDVKITSSSRGRIDDVGLRIMARIFPNVETFDLSWWGDTCIRFDLQDTDDKMIFASDHDTDNNEHDTTDKNKRYRCFSQLRELNLNGLQVISPQGWKRIGKMRNLVSLYLESCSSLGLRDGLRLLTSTPLKDALSGDEGAASSATIDCDDDDNPLPNLTYLNIKNCKVNGPDVVACIQKLKNLREIEAWGLPSFDRAAQEKLAKLCPALQIKA